MTNNKQTKVVSAEIDALNPDAESILEVEFEAIEGGWHSNGCGGRLYEEWNEPDTVHINRVWLVRGEAKTDVTSRLQKAHFQDLEERIQLF